MHSTRARSRARAAANKNIIGITIVKAKIAIINMLRPGGDAGSTGATP
jgi:hypothetical protein